MNSPKTYLVLFLAATTVGGALLAWRQYGELVELRAAAMNKDERADLQKRVADLEHLNRELQDRLASQAASTDVDGLLANAGELDRPGRDRNNRTARGERAEGRGRGGPQQVALRELMSKPEVQAIVSLQQKAALESRYAALFKNLNLPPEQIEKLKSLLAERSTTMQDIMSVAREQGIDPRENQEAFRKLVADAQNEINRNIQSAIGDQGFAQLANYEATMPQRNLVNDLQQRLSYTSTPLTTAQAEQMVQILATNAPQTSAGPGLQPGPQAANGGGRFAFSAGPGGPGLALNIAGSGGATVTPSAVTQAQAVLSPPQVAALQQIQQQQAAQQQLRKLVSDTLSSNQPSTTRNSGKAGAGSGGASTGTGDASQGRKRGGG